MKSTLATVNSRRRIWQSGQHVQMHTGTSIYAQAATTSAFNQWEGFTIAVTINFGIIANSGTVTDQTPFSISESDGANQFAGDLSGFTETIYGNTVYAMFADGGTVNLKGFDMADAADGVFASGKRATPVITHIYRADCTETVNNISATQINDAGCESTAPTVIFKKQIDSLNFTGNNWGTIGTSGYITIGGWKGHSGASLASTMSSNCGIMRVQVWKDTVLTDNQCKNTIGGATGITTLREYNDSDYSYPQPDHEWIPVLGNESTIPDTGSATAVNLTYAGSPMIGYLRHGELSE